MRSILNKLLYLMEKQQDAVLVSIISHAGSAPRGTGSQMLVGISGRIIGTIGGGPVEQLSEDLAKSLIRQKSSCVHDYALHSNPQEETHSICGGDIRVHFQFIAWDSRIWHDLAAQALACIAENQNGWLALRLDGETPALLSSSPALLCGDMPALPPVLRGATLTDAYFFLPLPIGERVIIFGAGHCSLSLTPILASVGFRVTVFDDRPEYAQAAAFPQAEKVLCGDFSQIDRTITVQPEDYVVVMTNGHAHDFIVQKQLLTQPLAYIGVIGSRSKINAVHAGLRECGISEEALRSIHTPIGMHIKAVTPNEIAVSIAGEMILERALKKEAEGTYEKNCPMH